MSGRSILRCLLIVACLTGSATRCCAQNKIEWDRILQIEEKLQRGESLSEGEASQLEEAELAWDLVSQTVAATSADESQSDVSPIYAVSTTADSGMSTFVVGVLVGSSLLCLGLILGVWVGRRTSVSIDSNSQDFRKLTQMFGGLLQWTNGVAQEVAEFKTLVDQVATRVHSNKGDSNLPSEATASLLETLQGANQQLQDRLSDAESALRTRAQEAEAYMAEARTDALTGVSNRRVFDDALNRRLAEWRRHGTAVSVVMVDVDHFKKLNDKYGHLAGDVVLRGVADVLQKNVRETDLVTRYGGEEFAVLMPAADSPLVCQAAERIRAAIHQAIIQYDGKLLSVTISCGAAQARLNEDKVSLVHRADQALYAAKNAGRDQAHWHDGQQCIRITSTSALDPSNNPRGNLAADFDDVCSNLRSRLFQIVETDADVTASVW